MRRFGRGRPRSVALAFASSLALAAGCEVPGLVGSDLAATGGGSGGFGSGSGGSEGGETGAPTTAITDPGESSAADGEETSSILFDVPPPDAPASCAV